MNFLDKYKLGSYESIIDFRINAMMSTDYFHVEKMYLYVLLVNMPFILMWFLYWQNALMILFISLPLCFMGTMIYMVNANNNAEDILLKYIEKTAFVFIDDNEFGNPQFKVGKYIVTISYGLDKVYGYYCFVKYGHGKNINHCINDTVKMKICKLLDPTLKYYKMD